MVEINVPGRIAVKTAAGWGVPLPPREKDRCKKLVWLPPSRSVIDRRGQCVVLRLTPTEYFGDFDVMVTPENNRTAGDIDNLRVETLVRRYQFTTNTRAA